ncbi:hypothetical protein IC229_01560 [Spirosoma sp. BT702]|uniref:Uncharacterized protein n=1 Tax=Spirosoma profusum TaxID=2771354 RepID=A0A926XSQ7_9BACT|nr:hypothetical protein [Spirosoma profusum]MBD2699304.1 hypothetical protein [Spirosoma profusum]
MTYEKYSDYADVNRCQERVLTQSPTATWKEARKYELEVSGKDLPAGSYMYRLEASYQPKTVCLVKRN